MGYQFMEGEILSSRMQSIGSAERRPPDSRKWRCFRLRRPTFSACPEKVGKERAPGAPVALCAMPGRNGFLRGHSQWTSCPSSFSGASCSSVPSKSHAARQEQRVSPALSDKENLQVWGSPCACRVKAVLQGVYQQEVDTSELRQDAS